MNKEEIRFECAHTGIGTGDLVRHKHDNRFGEVVFVRAVPEVKEQLVDDLLFGTTKVYFRDPSIVLARVEFLVAWMFNERPVVHRYYEDIPTFLLTKEDGKSARIAYV